jgi:hypothetical protein
MDLHLARHFAPVYPAGEQENGSGDNADHVSRDTAGILKNCCPTKSSWLLFANASKPSKANPIANTARLIPAERYCLFELFGCRNFIQRHDKPGP